MTAAPSPDPLPSYRGRFAPSPTGPLHFGSLLAATASYLRARQQRGTWLLRIEDIDPPREMPGAADAFLTTLEAFGFEWDEDVVYQSDRQDQYRESMSLLAESGYAYRCRCSRKDVQAAIKHHGTPIGVYPGTCLTQPPGAEDLVAWRFRTEQRVATFDDLLQGPQSVDFGLTQGDFVVWRKEALPSYQLAVTVDDLAQGITEVVRGIDLLNETAGQILLRQVLTAADEVAPIRWMHVPIIVNEQQQKLSKQTFAEAIDARNAAQQLGQVLQLLGVPVEPALSRAAVQDVWAYAIESWDPEGLKNRRFCTLD